MKECRCNKCVEERFEHERLRILMKLTPQELHLINKDMARDKTLWMFMGVGLGTLLGIFVGFILVLM